MNSEYEWQQVKQRTRKSQRMERRLLNGDTILQEGRYIEERKQKSRGEREKQEEEAGASIEEWG
eukprot:1540825-Pleurochrysis_carterae.AAC.1